MTLLRLLPVLLTLALANPTLARDGDLAGGDTQLDELDASGPMVVVVGSEGKGLSRLVRENCDAIVSIPIRRPAW